MLVQLLKAKLHNARVTETVLEYSGSITIDEALLEAAGLLPYELVLVSNLSNGERLETYVIPGPRGGGDICLNGAAARLAQTGDRIIVMAFALVEEEDASAWAPKVVILDGQNRISGQK